MERSVGGPIARVVLPTNAPEVAVMVVEPCALPLTNPALVIVAIEGVEEVQVAVKVKSRVGPAVKTPVAVNCWFAPTRMENCEGVTLMEAIAAGTTFKVAEPRTMPEIALMAMLPTERPVATPELVSVQTRSFSSAFQVTVLVRS